VATLAYRPNSASGKSQDLGLFVQRKEAGGFDRRNQFPDLRLLARTRVHAMVRRYWNPPTTSAPQSGFKVGVHSGLISINFHDSYRPGVII